MLSGRGLQFKIEQAFSKVLNEWENILPEGHHLISGDMLALENSRPPDIIFHYVTVYKNGVAIGVLYLQHLVFGSKHFNQSVLQKSYMKLAGPLVARFKAHLLVCGNLFRVNFQGFYFKEKEDRSLVFDILGFLKKHLGKKRYVGVLVKDCKREFVPAKYSCYRFLPFRQDLTMEMNIWPEWKTFDDYIGVLSKKYRQRALKIRKSVASLERKFLSLEEIIANSQAIENLYREVVQKQSLALGILNVDYFIEMKKQLGDKFEIVAFLKDGQLLAFSGHIYYPEKGAMELHYIGFNYQFNHEYNLYFNIIFDGIETAIQKGYKSVEMGRTAREAKASAGAKAVENFNYIWVKAGLPRMAVRFFSKKFEDRMGDDWLHRNPFKEAQPVIAHSPL